MQRFKIVNGFNGMECEDHDQNVFLFDTPEEAQAFIDEHHPWMNTGTLGDYTMIVPANSIWEHDHLGGAAFPNEAWQYGDFIFRVANSPHGNDFAEWLTLHSKPGMSPLYWHLATKIDRLAEGMERQESDNLLDGLKSALVYACDPLNHKNGAEEFTRVLLVLQSFGCLLRSGGVPNRGRDSRKILELCDADLPTNL